MIQDEYVKFEITKLLKENWKDKIPHYQWSIDNLITQDTTYETPCLEKYEEACETAIKYCLENLV